MTPLLTRSNPGSKKSQAEFNASRSPYRVHEPNADAPLNIRIEIKASCMHRAVHLSVALLSLLAPIGAQLPWLVSGFIVAWALSSITLLLRNPQTLTELRDEGKTWLLVSSNQADRVRYKNTDYHSAFLVIIAFITRTGRIRRVCIWRDSVTCAAFSWICARVTLGGADRQVNTVATARQRVFCHPIEVKQ